MKTKVLMVYPKVPPTFWNYDHVLHYYNRKAALPPVGLLTVAAMLPNNYEPKIVDLNTSKLRDKDIKWADLVFLSAMLIQKDSLTEVVALCKKHNKAVVAGGPMPLSIYTVYRDIVDVDYENIDVDDYFDAINARGRWKDYENVAFFKDLRGIDHFVLNEGEITLPKFLRDYEAGKPKKLYWDTTKPDITQTPVLRYDLLDVELYSSLSLQFSRGCPYDCEFCDIIEMFGRKHRSKHPEQFIKEIDMVYKTGFRGIIFIVDDNFVGNKKKTKVLLRRIIEWQNAHHYPFQFYTEASIDLAYDEELLDLMVEAGFFMVFIGIESPDTNSLRLVHKNQNLRQDLLESVKKIQSKGLAVTGGFIIGFDTDTEKIFQQQIDFIKEAGIPVAMVGLLAAMPNTQLYRRLRGEKRIIGLGYHTGNNVDIALNFHTKIPRKTLVEGYQGVLSELYGSPRSYLDNCLTMLKHMPQESFLSGKVKFTGKQKFRRIKAILMFMLINAFTPYGIRFTGYLFKIGKVNKGQIIQALLWGIAGLHFHKIGKKIIQQKVE